MKKLIIILGIILISINIFSQKEIQELDNWATYGDSNMVPVKITGVDEATFMYFIDVAPKIADESAGTGAIVKSATYARVDIAGSEYKVRIDTLVQDFVDFTTMSTAIAGGDFFALWDLTSTAQHKKITWTNLMGEVVNNSIVTDKMSVVIIADVDSAFIIDLLPNTITGQDITGVSPATKYGELSLQKIGNMVVGSAYDIGLGGNTGDAKKSITETVPAYMCPGGTNVHEFKTEQSAGNPAIIEIATDGTITFRSHGSSDYSIGICYYSP